jgi:hypothetical protein
MSQQSKHFSSLAARHEGKGKKSGGGREEDRGRGKGQGKGQRVGERKGTGGGNVVPNLRTSKRGKCLKNRNLQTSNDSYKDHYSDHFYFISFSASQTSSAEL